MGKKNYDPDFDRSCEIDRRVKKNKSFYILLIIFLYVIMDSNEWNTYVLQNIYNDSINNDVYKSRTIIGAALNAIIFTVLLCIIYLYLNM
jgi:hypothetical protein